MPTYVVQGCTILGNEILDAYGLPNFDCIFFKLIETQSNSLKVNVYAADGANTPLPNGSVTIFNYNTKNVKLRNEWMDRPIKITKNMLDKVTNNGASLIIFIKLAAKRYTHYEPGHPDHNKDFIGYKVRIRKEDSQ